MDSGSRSHRDLFFRMIDMAYTLHLRQRQQ